MIKKIKLWFRKSYYKALIKYVEKRQGMAFLCHYLGWHRLFCSFTDLEEVWENRYSKTTYFLGKSDETIKRVYFKRAFHNVWFPENQERIQFLNECLERLKEKQ